MLFPTPLLKQKGILLHNIGDAMDTLFFNAENFEYKKMAETVINVSIIGVLVLCQGLVPIHADSVKIARVTAPDFDIGKFKQEVIYEISPQARQEKFNQLIINKYQNSTIFDVANGVKHIKLTKYYNGKPVKMNIVEVDFKIAKDLKLTPVLSTKNKLKSRRTISKIAKENDALIALNGTFFKPQTGVPLGTLMINKKLYTGPIYDRVAFGIFDDKFEIDRIQLNASIEGSGQKIRIDNINQPRMLSTYSLIYTPEWGNYSPYAPKYGVNLLVKDNKIVKASANPIQLEENTYVISGSKKVLYPLLKDKIVNLSIETQPKWENVNHIISGGPYLVKDNEVFVDMTAQKLGAIGGRNPRSAIGYTQEGNLILIAVDGRENSSVGITLMELAKFMQSIGCINAINLDGGGSTVMYIDGKIVNNPQDKDGIPISNAIIISN